MISLHYMSSKPLKYFYFTITTDETNNAYDNSCCPSSLSLILSGCMDFQENLIIYGRSESGRVGVHFIIKYQVDPSTFLRSVWEKWIQKSIQSWGVHLIIKYRVGPLTFLKPVYIFFCNMITHSTCKIFITFNIHENTNNKNHNTYTLIDFILLHLASQAQHTNNKQIFFYTAIGSPNGRDISQLYIFYATMWLPKFFYLTNSLAECQTSLKNTR